MLTTSEDLTDRAPQPEVDPLSTAFATLVRDRDVTSVFQPMVHLGTGDVVGYEALSRGPHGTPFASAATLFGQAAVDGLEAELDWVCLGSAFEAFSEAGAPPSSSLFVNMSVGLHFDKCPSDIQRIVSRAESSMRVFIEVNDTALAADPAGVLETVDRARELGWGVSVDDVASSPGCLAVLPLVQADVVKVDMRLLRPEGGGDLAPAIAPLLRYVESSGATLVVKGIESEADMQFARALGATVGQGYHLGAPEPLTEQLRAPRAVVPLIGSVRDAHEFSSPREVVEDNLSQRMTTETMIHIGSFFVRRALATGSSPVVLIGQGAGGPLDSQLASATMTRLRESAVLCALFGFDAPAQHIPGVRYVAVPGSDPLRRQAFLVVLTESMTFAMVASRPDAGEAVVEVVQTQDEEMVYLLAEHLIRRIPRGDGMQVRAVERDLVHAADSDEPTEPPAGSGSAPAARQRSRWGLRRD